MPRTPKPTLPAGSPPAARDGRKNSAPVSPRSVDSVQEKWGTSFPFTLAAPSFAIPAGVAENCRFLADHFREIDLLFYETESCLAYTEEDLPPDLAELPCSWHVHLPLDLPWESGFETVWGKLDGLLDKCAYLSPHAYVLHPPTVPGMLAPLAARLSDRGVAPSAFLVENIGKCSLVPVWDEVVGGGFSACLDIGHILAYEQRDVLGLAGLWDRVRMLHVYGAERRSRHWPLAELDAEGQALLRTLLDAFTGPTVTLELFGQADLFESLDLLARWHAAWSANK